MTEPTLKTTVERSLAPCDLLAAAPRFEGSSAPIARTARTPMGEILVLVSAEIRQRKLLFFGLALFILFGTYLTGVVLGAMDALQQGAEVSTALLLPSMLHFATLGAVPIVVGSLLFEARLIGWERSSLSKLFRAESQSVRSDLVYAALYCSRLKDLLGLLLSLGIAYYGRRLILTHFDFAMLRDAPFLLMLFVQFLVGSFVMHFWHRISHTRFFWEFHKVHHSGEDMTMVNNFREHPVLDTLRTTVETLPAAVLGVPAAVLLVYAALVGAVSLWFHSDYDWKLPFIERYVLIGARAHRIHHSPLPQHHHSNYGWLVLWERLFGTFREDPAEIPIGLEDPLFNKQGTFAEMWMTQRVGARALIRELRAIVPVPAAGIARHFAEGRNRRSHTSDAAVETARNERRPSRPAATPLPAHPFSRRGVGSPRRRAWRTWLPRLQSPGPGHRFGTFAVSTNWRAEPPRSPNPVR